MEYNEEESKETERAYLSPNIARQRARTVAFLNPQPGDHVVDIGCGPGMLAVELANIVGPGGMVTGIDSSASMLELAETRCKKLPQVKLLERSATDLNLESNIADGATCTQVLLYVEDVPKALREFHRVLKPGGNVVVLETDWRSTVLHSDDEALTERIVESWDHAVPSPRLPARLEKLLKDVGFVDIEVEAFPIICRSGVPDDFAMAMIRQCSQSACEQGIISSEQGNEWIRGLVELGEANEFFLCVNRFLFKAAKL